MTEKPEIAPCPFCGGPCFIGTNWLGDTCQKCGYNAPYKYKPEALAQHNHIAEGLRLLRESALNSSWMMRATIWRDRDREMREVQS